MNNTVRVVHERIITETATFEAYVLPSHYMEWCQAYNREDPKNGDNLRDYLMEGYGDSAYTWRGHAVAPEKFATFETPDLAAIIVERFRAAADEEWLRQIADEEIREYGQRRPVWNIASARNLSDVVAQRVYDLVQRATIQLPPNN